MSEETPAETPPRLICPNDYSHHLVGEAKTKDLHIVGEAYARRIITEVVSVCPICHVDAVWISRSDYVDLLLRSAERETKEKTKA